MSTRCQVKVTQSGISLNDQAVTLYHHCDGYPTNMLPLIQSAYDLGHRGWELGRTGKSASFLCASDPGSFEPEAGHELHGDIEWYYVVQCVNSKGGTIDEVPSWNVFVYDPSYDYDRNTSSIKLVGVLYDIGNIKPSDVKQYAKYIESNENRLTEKFLEYHPTLHIEHKTKENDVSN